MKRFEKLLNGLVIGSTFPLLLGLLSVMIWFYLDKSEDKPVIYLFVGILSGLIIDYKFLKGWIGRRFDLSVWFLAAIYIVYNIFVFGFFMGLPVFNVFMGFFAGYYFSNRICVKNVESKNHSKIINQVALFSGFVMTLICVSSGFLALADNEASAMIKEVLGLRFEVTRLMVWGIVIIGGLTLIMANILLTRITMNITINKLTRRTQIL